MDKGLLSQYQQFLKNGGGIDLMERLKMTEAKYMMEGMKDPSIEGKGIALAKMQATYDIRTMLDDLSKPALSPQKRSVGSK